MNLEQFRYIKEVSLHRSISKAAKKLYLTQPTISNAIHNFEEEVGYKVFRRSNQGVELTEEGERVMEHIDIILGELNRIQNQTDNPEYISGDVYVDASPMICSTIMPRIIIACKQAYPGITVHVKESFSDKSVTSLMAGLSSISVSSFVGLDQVKQVESNLASKNFGLEELLSENYMLYTGKECPLAQLEEVTVEETYAYPWILLQENSFDDNCMIMGEDEMCPNSIIAFQDKDSVKQAVAANLGVAVLPSSFAGEEDPYVTSGLIHRVALKDVDIKTFHVLMVPKKRRLTGVEELFLGILQEYYKSLRNR